MKEAKLSFFGETYQIHTALSRVEISTILEKEIEPVRLVRLKAFDGDFEGTHDNNSFTMTRIIRSRYYRNFAPPRIEGTIRSSGSGSEIEVKIARPVRGILFLAVWVVVWFIALISKMTGHLGEIGIALPLAALIGGFAFESLVFWVEVRTAKHSIEEMFHRKFG